MEVRGVGGGGAPVSVWPVSHPLSGRPTVGRTSQHHRRLRLWPALGPSQEPACVLKAWSWGQLHSFTRQCGSA